MVLMIAGPSSTTNRTGRMKTIIGTVSIAGRRAAFASARSIRSLRYFRSQHAQRLRQWGAVTLGLPQRIDDAFDCRPSGAPAEVVQCLMPIGQESEQIRRASCRERVCR